MIKISQFTSWNHHRSGWNFCIDQIKHLHFDCRTTNVPWVIPEKKPAGGFYIKILQKNFQN